MHRIMNGRTPVDRFNSLSEFLDATTYAYSGDTTDEFFGSVTLKRCKQLATNGWPEGLKEVNKFKGKIESITAKYVAAQEIIYDVTGLDFDMGLVMEGRPECWYDFVPKEEQKTIRIIYGIGVSAALSHEMIALRGATICAMIDILEAHNVRVELDVYFDYSPAYSGNQIAIIPIKTASQSLDLDRVAFVLMHAGMNRKLGFSYATQEIAKLHGRNPESLASGAVGWSSILPDFSEYDFVMQRGYSGFPQYNDAKSMINWILEQLKTFGINLTKESI